MDIQNGKTNPGNNAQIWVRPWKYTESFIITINLLILGFAIEAISGGAGVKLPGFPVNIYFVVAFGALLAFLYVKFKAKPLIIWLSSVPAGIVAIIIYAVMVLLLGFIPQDMEQPNAFLKLSGLWHVKNSWPFLFIQLYFLIVLAMVTFRRAIPFKTKNIGFLLNHFGLWLTILAAGLSSSDLQRLSVNLYEKEKESNIGIAENGDKYPLPFSLKLLDFDIIEYNPKIGIFDIGTGKFIMGSAQSMPFAGPNLETNLGDWHLQVVKYYPLALYKSGILQPTDSSSGYPAAQVLAKNNLTGDTVRGWISTGSVTLHPDYFHLKGKEYLMLELPAPKKFYSKLVVFNGSGASDTVQVAVNKSHSIGVWSIYQSGYDEQMRRWSTLSVIEAVKDPWLPVVYTGIFLLVVGAIYMFWIGKDKKE